MAADLKKIDTGDYCASLQNSMNAKIETNRFTNKAKLSSICCYNILLFFHVKLPLVVKLISHLNCRCKQLRNVKVTYPNV